MLFNNRFVPSRVGLLVRTAVATLLRSEEHLFFGAVERAKIFSSDFGDDAKNFLDDFGDGAKKFSGDLGDDAKKFFG